MGMIQKMTLPDSLARYLPLLNPDTNLGGLLQVKISPDWPELPETGTDLFFNSVPFF